MARRPARRPPTRGAALKADPRSQETLLELQRHDSTLAQLRHRKASLAEHALLTELQTKAADLDGRRVEAETLVADLNRDQRRADGEVEQVRARRTRDQQRLDAGQVTSPKDLENIQHEIVALDRRIGSLEDAELEVMEALEEAQSTLDTVLAEVGENDAAVRTTTEARDEAVRGIDAEAAAVVGERERTAAEVPDDLRTLYDRVREQQGGLAAAALRQRRCEGCRLELNGADLREIKALPDDDVVRCPECNRILVRVSDSGL